MQCERLIKMIKSWYLHVRDETMAPARMISFIEQHATTCSICLEDPDLKEEIAKISELILPESKIPKAARQASSDLDDNEEYDDEFSEGEETDEEEGDESEGDEELEEIEEDEFFDDDEED